MIFVAVLIKLYKCLMKNLKMSPPSKPPPTRSKPEAPATPTKAVAKVASRVAVSKADLKKDPVLGKYAKMASVGVPAPNILLKMKGDEISGEKVAIFCSAFGVVDNATKGEEDVEEEEDEEEEEEEDKVAILSKEEVRNCQRVRVRIVSLDFISLLLPRSWGRMKTWANT